MTLQINPEKKIEDRLPTRQERDAAKALHQILVAQKKSDNTCLSVTDASGASTTVSIPPALSVLLSDLMQPISRGDSVALTPITQLLTTQQAADLLNVSHPYLLSLLKNGTLNAELVGRHRRVRAEDLFTYKNRCDAGRASTLDQLAKTDSDLL